MKIDHNFNDANRFFARFSNSGNGGAVPDIQPLGSSGPNASAQNIKAHTFVMDYVKVLNPAMILDIRSSFAQQRNIAPGNFFDTYNAASAGYSSNFVSQQAYKALPYVTISGYRSIGDTSKWAWDHYTYALNGSFTWLLGRHTLKTGWDGRMFVDNENSLTNAGGTFNFDGAWANGPNPSAALPVGSQPYYSLAIFLLGDIGSGGMVSPSSVARTQYYNAAFLQDDWRPTGKLTLNLGLRFETETGSGLEYKGKFHVETCF